MKDFKDFFASIFIICLICALSRAVTSFSSGKASTALKVICNLIILLALLTSLMKGCDISDGIAKIKDIDILTDHQKQYSQVTFSEENGLMDSISTELENTLSHTINEKFGINPIAVNIEFNIKKQDTTENEIAVKKAVIVLPNNTDPIICSAIKSFSDSLFAVDTEIIKAQG